MTLTKKRLKTSGVENENNDELRTGAMLQTTSEELFCEVRSISNNSTIIQNE